VLIRFGRSRLGFQRGNPKTDQRPPLSQRDPFQAKPKVAGRPPGQPDPGDPAQPQAAESSGGVAPGSLVLATLGAGEGWWESLVVEIKEDKLTLQWRDWPEEPSFVKSKSEIALLHPSRNAHA